MNNPILEILEKLWLEVEHQEREYNSFYAEDHDLFWLGKASGCRDEIEDLKYIIEQIKEIKK